MCSVVGQDERSYIDFGSEFDGGSIDSVWINDMNINYPGPWSLLVFDSFNLRIDTSRQCHEVTFASGKTMDSLV